MTFMRATITVIYEADPKNYGTSDPKKMAKIDMENALEEIVQFGEATLTITEVK